MRRTVSILLVVIFGCLLIAPLLASDPESNLPPCCRRHGKHHCTMQIMQDPGGSPGFTAVREKCPCFPAGTTASHSFQFQPEIRQSCSAPVQTARSILARLDPAPQREFLRGHPRRGPPSPLA